jgi:hypothetical protein
MHNISSIRRLRTKGSGAPDRRRSVLPLVAYPVAMSLGMTVAGVDAWFARVVPSHRLLTSGQAGSMELICWDCAGGVRDE